MKAIYHQIEHEDGRITHGINHDSGGFSVSTEQVGLAVETFLNAATTIDMHVVHSALLGFYHRAMTELEALPEAE